MFEFKDLYIGHGRVVTRIYAVVTDMSYIENSDKWPKLTTLIKIDSER